MKRKVDVAIIGAGSGGLSARREIAKKTDNYLVIDGGILGTTCARVGCMPSKVLIQVAEDFNRRKKYDEEGIRGGDKLSINSVEVMKHVRKLRDRFVKAVIEDMSSWTETHLIQKFVSFKDEHTLICDNLEIEAKKIVIASGSSPVIPDIFKGYEKFLVTTDTFFEMDKLPESVAVIGVGVIGLELGQAMSRLGVDVVSIGRRKAMCGITDPELSAYACRKMSEQMTLSFAGVDSVKEINGQLEIVTDGKSYLVDKVLLTAGRKPQWNKLGFDKLGFDFSSNKLPLFNTETRQLIDFPHIFIAGDNSGEKQILHEASDEGRIAGFNCVNDITAFKARTPLMITFSDPSIATAGESFEQLTAREAEFEIGQVSFEGQGRSIVKLKEIGMLRVYGDKESGQILGAELMAPDGEHLAHLLSWVISQKMNVNEVLSLPFYHPVIEESLRTALRSLRDKLNLEEHWPLEIKKR